MNTGRLVNLLGAFAIAASDEIETAAGETDGHDLGALNLIGHAPGLSIQDLARCLNLSHAGTVRLVERLVRAGGVEKRAGKDLRTASLRLTSAGKRTRERLQSKRQGRLRELLAPLSVQERQMLERVIEKMMISHVQDDVHAGAVCRYCDEDACTPCPMERI